MQRVILRRDNVRIVRMVAGIAAAVVALFCGFKFVTAVSYSAITVAGTNGSITVNNNAISGLNITPAVVFNQTGDSITYQVELSDPDGKPFKIKSVTDDNTSDCITTSYSYSNKKDSSDKDILISLSYSNYLPSGTELNMQDIHITIDIEEEDEKEESAIVTPDTGSNTSVFLKTASGANSEELLPYAVTFIASVAVVFTIMSKKHRMQFTKIASVAIVLTISGSAISAHAKSSNLQITIHGENISAKAESILPQTVVSAIFPNIYNNRVQDRPDGAAPGNAIILKTLDNKYVLMDTGPNTEDIRTVIYNTLVNLQGNERVVLDYLIISHLDGDHYGNAVRFINDDRITINNVVVKHESLKENPYSNIVQAAKNNDVRIVTSGDVSSQAYLNNLGITSYDKINEGMVLSVGNYLKLNFFNTADVYYGKECQAGYKLDWTAKISQTSTNYVKTSNDEYVYFDGSEYSTLQDGEYDISSSKYPYANVTLKTTPTLAAKENGSGMNRYFYAIKGAEDEDGLCKSNPNAFGILAEVITSDQNKYMYFPGDIENAGYGRLSSGANSSAIYSDVAFEGGDFIENITSYSIPAEDNTANAIYTKLAADASRLGVSVNTMLNNIVVYQMSHHGINNSERAIWKLNMNRGSGIYAIEENSDDMTKSNNFRMTKTYYYTLGNLPAANKIKVGDNARESVICTVENTGASVCE